MSMGVELSQVVKRCRPSVKLRGSPQSEYRTLAIDRSLLTSSLRASQD